MEKQTLVLYFFIGIISGFLGMAYIANHYYGNEEDSDKYIFSESVDKFYENPMIDDLYIILDTTNQKSNYLKITWIKEEAITFFKGDSILKSMPNPLWIIDAFSNEHFFTDSLITINKEELAPHLFKQEGKLLFIYRQYQTSKMALFRQILFSPLCIFIILLAFFIIWFGTSTSDFVGGYVELFPRTGNILFLACIFYLLNPIYFPHRIYSVLFSFFSVIPIYLFFKKLKNQLFQNQIWLVREAYKFVLLAFFGYLFQIITFAIISLLSFEFSSNNLHYMDGFAALTILSSGFFWFYIAIGNFLNNVRKYLVGVKNKEQTAQLKAQQSKAELDALQSRVNPHFLYNSLNSIAGLAQEDPAKTEEMAIALSHFYKQSTNRKGEHWNTIDEALELLQNYLSIEKIRFGDRLQFDILCPEFLKEEKIPRFLIQPLVENAIKYGYQASTNSMSIRLELEKTEEQLFIRLFDQGPPFPNNLQSGYGVQSVQKKLELLYPDRHELAFINAPEKHVSITLSGK